MENLEKNQGRYYRNGPHEKYADFISQVAKKTIDNKTISDSDIKKLSEYGLLEATTMFRMDMFPGEDKTFFYKFMEDGVENSGFIGFDKNSKLVSIDKRSPEKSPVYLKGDKWVEAE